MDYNFFAKELMQVTPNGFVTVSEGFLEFGYPFTPLFEEKKFIGCVFSKVH
jgi:hypothetical protein